MPTNLDILQGHQMSDEEIEQFLTEQGVGVLSMASNGTPYGIPLSFGYDSNGGIYLLFAGHSETGQKVRYAESAQDVSFLVYDIETTGDWRSVIVEGSLDRITANDWERAREAMADNAYRPNLLTNVDRSEDPRVWNIDIEEWSGRVSDSS